MNFKNVEALNLTEIFASIQGETSFAGLPTTFIRLAACNLRCTWCDTPYSFGRGSPWSLTSIVEQAQANGCQHICVTGGEPLLQENVYPLMAHLCDKGYTVSIETGGSLPVSRIDPRVHIILDIKCPGSAMEKKNLWSNLNDLKPKDEVKFVILDEKDYEWAKTICLEHSLNDKVKNILFSPVYGELDPQNLTSWILRDKIPVRLNIQIHKTIWSPTTKGV